MVKGVRGRGATVPPPLHPILTEIDAFGQFPGKHWSNLYGKVKF